MVLKFAQNEPSPITGEVSTPEIGLYFSKS